ncbi:MAG: fibronectin type III domain-containing protein, partial [Bacteroidales bacterium]|nr:fibronectin type III domain-containing protein [Bacteroidales bacterium]
MKKKIFLQIYILIFILFASINLKAQYSGGSGTSLDPYQIANADDLIELSNTPANWVYGTYFIQTANIIFNANETLVDWDGDGTATWDAEDQLGFSPIGDDVTIFDGVYDGQGHTITNFYINRPTEYFIALFGWPRNNVVIKNLGMVDCAITGARMTGAFGGRSSATISNCYNTGNITSIENTAGGIVANNEGTISNCYNTGNISGSTEVGGVVGANAPGTLNYCYNTGSITGSSYTGGITGFNSGAINDYCLWNTETSLPTTVGVAYTFPGAYSAGAVGKTTAEMKIQSTYTDAGWDFVGETTNGSNNHWAISGTLNNGYPYLYFSYPPGNALDFDNWSTNSDEYFKITPNQTVTGNFTVEGWFLAYSTNHFPLFSGRGPGAGSSFHLQIQNGNTIHSDIGNGTSWIINSSDASVNYSLNQWNHIAYVVESDGSTVSYTVYLNGVEVGQGSTSSALSPMLCLSGGEMYIGAGAPGFSERIDGKLDEVRLWNTARNITEIKSTMYTEITGSESGLVAYYNCNEESGNIINDLTNSQNGTFQDASNPTWTESYALVAPEPTAATSITESGFTANWTAPVTGTAGGYYLDVDDNSDFSSLIVDGQDVTGATYYDVTGLSPTTTYYYRVRAYKSSVGDEGTWHYSNPISVTTNAPMSPPGNALDFDGVNDYVSIGNWSVPANITVEAWVYPTDISGPRQIASQFNAWSTSTSYILRLDNGVPGLYLSDGNDAHAFILNATQTLNTNEWCHIAATYDGTTAKIYINGILNIEAPVSINLLQTTTVSHIIGKSLLYGAYFSGKIEEVRYWNYARTNCEVQQAMSTELVGNEAGLIAYYDFNQGVAGGDNTAITTLTDKTGNHNGTLTSFALTGTTSNFVTSDASITGTGTFSDEFAPVPDVATLTDVTDECSATPTAPTATDACAGTVTGTTTTTFPITTQGTTVVTWTYDDGNGNSSTQTQNVVIDDVTAPITPTLADVTEECSATPTAPTTT